eukprot:TRINITY_DN34929_c0_g1_i1.p1 TRINITY_DN34929_c0_g1~~TRINITY_DN34929_c0_g1_i1.p1  ORF type:complete len:376 (+),score=33.85 TRINITY_DN34929_c0_g1_i1:155-1282(+)
MAPEISRTFVLQHATLPHDAMTEFQRPQDSRSGDYEDMDGAHAPTAHLPQKPFISEATSTREEGVDDVSVSEGTTAAEEMTNLTPGPPPGLDLSPSTVSPTDTSHSRWLIAANLHQADVSGFDSDEASDASVFGYGPHGSPKRRARSGAPAPTDRRSVLAYGPHGSPKRRPLSGAPAPLPAEVLLSYGVEPRARLPWVGHFPHPSQLEMSFAQTYHLPLREETSVVLGYGPHGSPKRVVRHVPPSFAVQDDAVLSYGPHGSPKRRGKPVPPKSCTEVPPLPTGGSSGPRKVPMLPPSLDEQVAGLGNVHNSSTISGSGEHVQHRLHGSDDGGGPVEAFVPPAMRWLDPSLPVKKHVPHFFLQESSSAGVASAIAR